MFLVKQNIFFFYFKKVFLFFFAFIPISKERGLQLVLKGKLEPRYSFILNSYSEYRASKCPKCDLLTKQRKFVFLIFINPQTTMPFGITSRFCSECDLIVLHQNDLESLLVAACESKNLTEIIGNPYLVIGTVDRKIWRKNINNFISSSIQEILEHTSDFKEVLNFEYQPAGWYKNSE